MRAAGPIGACNFRAKVLYWCGMIQEFCKSNCDKSEPREIGVYFLHVPSGSKRRCETEGHFCVECGRFQDYIWSDGNFACDCNRTYYWNYADGEGPDIDVQCGDSRFLIEKIVVIETNEIVYEEGLEENEG